MEGSTDIRRFFVIGGCTSGDIEYYQLLVEILQSQEAFVALGNSYPYVFTNLPVEIDNQELWLVLLDFGDIRLPNAEQRKKFSELVTIALNQELIYEIWESHPYIGAGIMQPSGLQLTPFLEVDKAYNKLLKQLKFKGMQTPIKAGITQTTRDISVSLYIGFRQYYDRFQLDYNVRTLVIKSYQSQLITNVMEGFFSLTN